MAVSPTSGGGSRRGGHAPPPGHPRPGRPDRQDARLRRRPMRRLHRACGRRGAALLRPPARRDRGGLGDHYRGAVGKGDGPLPAGGSAAHQGRAARLPAAHAQTEGEAAASFAPSDALGVEAHDHRAGVFVEAEDLGLQALAHPGVEGADHASEEFIAAGVGACGEAVAGDGPPRLLVEQVERAARPSAHALNARRASAASAVSALA